MGPFTIEILDSGTSVGFAGSAWGGCALMSNAPGVWEQFTVHLADCQIQRVPPQLPDGPPPTAAETLALREGRAV